MHQYILKRLLLMIPTLLGARCSCSSCCVWCRATSACCACRAGPVCRAQGDRTVPHRARPRPALCRAVPGFHLGLRPVRPRQVDVDRTADRQEIALRFQLSLQIAIMATLTAIAAGDPARHDLGRQAEHLDRLCRARLQHCRHRDAVVLARHPDHPRPARHQQGAVRLALDAADQYVPSGRTRSTT